MLGFILVVLVITLFLDLLIRKKYDITTEFSLYRPVNNTQKQLERIWLILFIIALFIDIFVFSYTITYTLLFAFLTILIGLRALMEFKYEKEEKTYIANLLWALSYCIIFLVSIFFTL